MRTASLLLAALPFAAALTPAFAQKPTAPKPVAYAAVEKIMKAKCVGCHQGAMPAGGVNLSSRAEILKGKYKGQPLVVPKNAKASVLSKGVHGTGVQKMPPGGALPAGDIKTIDAWIASGAKA